MSAERYILQTISSSEHEHLQLMSATMRMISKGADVDSLIVCFRKFSFNVLTVKK